MEIKILIPITHNLGIELSPKELKEIRGEYAHLTSTQYSYPVIGRLIHAILHTTGEIK